MRHLGSPTTETWPELSTLPDYNKITFPYHKGTLWEQVIPDAEPEAIDLVKNILLYNSSKRLTANEVYQYSCSVVHFPKSRKMTKLIFFQALQHEYFHREPFPCPETQLIKPPQG